MAYIERIWYSSESKSNLYRWDAGDEVWELDGDSILHYRVISRAFLNDEQTEMKEILEPLPETAIPAEIFMQGCISNMGWSMKETEKEEATDNIDIDSWDWTPLSHCIPSNVLYQSPSPICDDPIEWYVTQESSH
jgi:hypothetical protein